MNMTPLEIYSKEVEQYDFWYELTYTHDPTNKLAVKSWVLSRSEYWKNIENFRTKLAAAQKICEHEIGPKFVCRYCGFSNCGFSK